MSGSAPVLYCTADAVLIAERQRIGGRVVERRVAEPRHVDAHAAGHGQVRARPPLVLDVRRPRRRRRAAAAAASSAPAAAGT